MLGKYLDSVRQHSPLVHNMTNYVTVNDVANLLIAAGAAPIMADDIDDATEITSICSALNINIGTLNARTIKSILATGQRAQELGHPIVLDPVGVGASKLRTETAQTLIKAIDFSVIKGNISEIKTLAAGSGNTRGVDASASDVSSDAHTAELAKAFAAHTGSIIVITGAVDAVADQNTCYLIKNGSPLMGQITGSGCMLSALLAAYVSANNDRTDIRLEAAVAAVAAMGVSGELAQARMQSGDGNASYRTYLIDTMYNLTAEQLDSLAKYERV